jgi:hypothetical protein
MPPLHELVNQGQLAAGLVAPGAIAGTIAGTSR